MLFITIIVIPSKHFCVIRKFKYVVCYKIIVIQVIDMC